MVLGRRRRRAARLVEVPPEQRARVIRAYLLRWGRRVGSGAVAREARFYFGVSAEASLREIQDVVEHYPVFRIEYAGDAGIGAEEIAERVYRLETGRGLTDEQVTGLLGGPRLGGLRGDAQDVHPGAGVSPAAARIRRIVPAPGRYPRPWSSPWMRR